MRAAKWDLENGKKRIEGTLKWRREYKPDLIPPDEVRSCPCQTVRSAVKPCEQVRIESETGKM